MFSKDEVNINNNVRENCVDPLQDWWTKKALYELFPRNSYTRKN